MSEALSYHRHLEDIMNCDLEYVRRKDTQYNASWKRRGGIGAFFTIVRPWDRLESMLNTNRGGNDGAIIPAYDMLQAIQHEGLEGPDGSLIACVRDIRRYLLLVEAEITERLSEMKARAVPKTDSNKHAAYFGGGD